MSTHPDESLERVAESVAESMPLDWGTLLQSTPDLSGPLSGLRAIAGIAAAYRSAAGDAPELLEPADETAATVRLPAESSPNGEGGDPRFLSDSSEARSPLFKWGHLEVLARLGEGTFGEIYRAFDATLQREVALKLYKQGAEPSAEDDPMVERSGRGLHPGLDEARSMARLRHPNVLTVHGVDVREGRLGIWTDLLEGETLEDRLAKAGSFSDTEAALVGIELCRALAAIHRAGLVHGDVKTSNVMRESGGAIVLLDFSSNREMRAVAGMAGTERASGTPLVSPPEVLLGELPAASADLYALGVLLFRLVTRRYPVEAKTLAQLVERHRSGPRNHLRALRPELSPAFVSTVERAIDPDPAARIESAAEFEHALQSVFRADDQTQDPALGEGGGDRIAELQDRLRTAQTGVRGNLQAPLSKILGREREIEMVRRRMDESRLVTLVGTGGTGKTRLSVEVAHAYQPEVRDGVWWVDLTPTRDGARVCEAIAGGLGLQTHGVMNVRDMLMDHLCGRQVLILMDNCEHILPEVRDAAQGLLAQHAEVRILATSRERLGLEGEEVVYVDPLVQPSDDMPLDMLRRNPCVALFQRRARLVDPMFEVSRENAKDVAEICRRLDGLPLAIELAAARVQVMPAPEIRARLDDRFALLSGGGSGAGTPRHHETLQALLDWDYALLTSDEQRLLRRMSPFVAGWTLQAAEHMSGLEDRETSKEPALALLGRLLDKSLVQRSVVSGGRAYRFNMLETVREYAKQRLVDAGEWSDTLRRQRAWYARMAKEADAGMIGPQAPEWRARLQMEHDNINQVVTPENVENARDAKVALRILIDFWRYFFLRGHWRPVLEVTQALVERADLDEASSFYAEVQSFCGGIATFIGDLDGATEQQETALRIQERLGEAVSAALSRMRLANILIRSQKPGEAEHLYEEALQTYREAGDILGQATVLNNLARVAYHAGNHAKVESLLLESLELQRSLGHPWGIASALSNLGGLMGGLNRLDEARKYTEEAIERLRALGDEAMVATSLQNLSTILAQLGEEDAARDRIAEAAKIHARVGDRRNWSMALIVQGNLEASAGELETAREAFHHAMVLTKDFSDSVVLSQIFDGLADVARRASEHRRAARLFGAAKRVRDDAGSKPMPAIQAALDEAYASARESAGDQVFGEEFEAGRSMETSRVLDWLMRTDA